MENHSQYPDTTLKEIFSRIEESLHRIEAQTCKTNGRVTKLESWRSYIAGAITIVTVLGGTIIGLSLYVYNMQLGSIKTELDKHVIQVK